MVRDIEPGGVQIGQSVGIIRVRGIAGRIDSPAPGRNV